MIHHPSWVAQVGYDISNACAHDDSAYGIK
jgi:hypothetical protein